VSGQYIFINIVKFANWFYNREHHLEVNNNYPKQNNNNDCGMFLLCGIKDTLRNYTQWSFSQKDMRYKRIIFANEIMNEQISGFEK
jgi:Ulp1 family protease